MTTDFHTYPSSSENEFLFSQLNQLPADENTWSKVENKLPEILFITSLPPRECGIATYSKDLIDALNLQFDNSFEISVCALETDSERHVYSDPPKFILNTDERNAYSKTAFRINNDMNIQLVVIQHEFGFFSSKKEEFKRFIHTLTKPLVFVFHTVLPNPNNQLKTKVMEMATLASSLIVMTENAAKILKDEYAVSPEKITIIPHGTHLVAPLNRQKLKEAYQLTNRKVLSTFGLLGSSKSIETSLDALPEVIKTHPDVIFLILGKTHPSLVKNEGEKYREMLENKVKTLHLEKHVRFVNQYLALPTLLEYLQLSDIYLFTSKDPNQAVSGTFSYAVSSGCPVISTPIPHAKEVLNSNNGLIFDFENSDQLAKAILSLLDNEKLMAEISSNSLHRMASTAWQNSAIAHALLFEKINPSAFHLTYKVPAFNLNHLKKMTTDSGMIQFSKLSIPDLESGYALDDNARALIAMCQHYELFRDEQDLNFIDTYLQFITHCMDEQGQFLNYVDVEGEFTSQNFSENLEDSNGRTIWALGFVVSLSDILPIHFTIQADNLLQNALHHLHKIHSTRAMAFIIKGLHYQDNADNLPLMNTLAQRLVQMYKHEKRNDWHWFENYLTYGNSLLPEAMLCAYQSTHNNEYKEIAIESFDFLLSKIFIDQHLKVISNKGWMIKDRKMENVVGGEQAIDVAYTLMTLEKFYTLFKNEDYKQKIKIAFSWFLGDNHLHQIVYNPSTGGCYDGVEEHNVNLNQGAESTLSYLLSRLVVERLKIKDDQSNKLCTKEFLIPVDEPLGAHEYDFVY
jgi:glycosyltransferase involved in cell wall biosynthesis